MIKSPYASFVSVLKACKAASGAGSKQAIKEALSQLDEIGQRLFIYAMDPFLVYGIKKFDRLPQHEYSSTDNQNVELITRVLDRLAAGELTGNAARTAWATALAEQTWETAQFLELIVNKDLDAGFSEETYNKVHPQNPVRVFNVMLAEACKTDEDFEEIAYPCLADIKYDGERNICIVKTGVRGDVEIVHHSRSGKIAEHMVGLFDDELRAIHAAVGDFILDGERMARTYIDTVNAKKRGPEGDAARKNMVFRAFFLMPLSDWLAQSTKITMRETREQIAALITKLGLNKIILTDSKVVNDHGEMMKELDRVTTPGFQGMPKGQEGLILKVMSATYEWDRTATWCKVKKFFDADMRIDSWEYGRKKNAHRMGRVNGHGWLEDGTYFEVGVGSGWTDEMRDDITKNFETKYKGKTMVVKYQEVSKSKNKEHASLRFPTVDREKFLRDDKIVPEKP